MQPELPRSLVRASRPNAGFLLVLVAAVLPYLGSFDGQMVAGDLEFIADNPVMGSTHIVRDAFTQSYWFTGARVEAPYYRPLVVLLDYFDHARFGLRPAGYHVTNLILHALCSLLVLILARQLLVSERAAYVAALVFAVHPVHVHAVAYISGRTSLLGALWLLPSVCCAIEAARRDSSPVGRRIVVASVLCAALALLSKESTAPLPALVFGALLLISPGRPSPRAVLRRHWPLLAALAGALVLYLVARWLVLGHLGSTRQPLWYRLDAFSALLTMAKIVGFYPSKLLWPTGLSYLPPFVPSLGPGDPAGIAWLLCLGGTTLWVLYPSGRHRQARFWVFWVLACVAPVSGIASLEYFVKEHHAYLAAVGFCMLVGTGLDHGGAWLRGRLPAAVGAVAGVAALTVLLAALALATVRHVETFSSERALYASVVALEPRVPDAAFAHLAMNKSAHRFATSRLNLGLQDLQDGHCERALAHFERAAVLARSDGLRVQAGYLQGVCLMQLGRLQQARTVAGAALALDDERPEPAMLMSDIARALGDPAEAARYRALACRRGAAAACAP